MIANFYVNYSLKWSAVSAAVVLGLVAYRRYMVRLWGHCKSKKSLKGQVVIITGANSGLGKATAIELSKRGARIILACRDVNKARSTIKEILMRVPTCSADDLLAFQLDLASFDSIRRFVDEFSRENIGLNVLINNAGVMACNFQLTVDEVENQMSVNHYGSFLLTNLLIQKLETSSPSKIVFVTSTLAQKGRITLRPADPLCYNKREAYANSKLANYVYAVELSNRLERGPQSGLNGGVAVYLASPGHVWTNLGRHLKPSWWKLFLLWPILIPLAYLFVRTPSQGCQSIVYCAVEDGLESGALYRNCQQVSHLQNVVKQQHLAASLWNHSDAITKEKDTLFVK